MMHENCLSWTLVRWTFSSHSGTEDTIWSDQVQLIPLRQQDGGWGRGDHPSGSSVRLFWPYPRWEGLSMQGGGLDLKG